MLWLFIVAVLVTDDAGGWTVQVTPAGVEEVTPFSFKTKKECERERQVWIDRARSLEIPTGTRQAITPCALTPSIAQN